MEAETSYHMTPEEFRRRGREVVDWIAHYWQRLESLVVDSGWSGIGRDVRQRGRGKF